VHKRPYAIHSVSSTTPGLEHNRSAPRAHFAAIEPTIRHTTLRGLGFIGLLAIALVHLLDLFSKFEETPYLAVMYILLMVALAIARRERRPGVHELVPLAG
jgi:hypothetical protein